MSDTTDTDATRDGARSLGNITDQPQSRVKNKTGSLDGTDDSVDYFTFTLDAKRHVSLGLRDMDADADLVVEDAHGNVLATSRSGWTIDESIGVVLAAGTYYVRVEAQGAGDNDYRLRYQVARSNDDAVNAPAAPDPVDTPATDTDSERTGANDWGDITSQTKSVFAKGSVDGGDDATDYYKFTLDEARKVVLGLRRQDADADLILEDGDGNVLATSAKDGTQNESLSVSLTAGTYYVRVASQEAGANDYNLKYATKDPDNANLRGPRSDDGKDNKPPPQSPPPNQDNGVRSADGQPPTDSNAATVHEDPGADHSHDRSNAGVVKEGRSNKASGSLEDGDDDDAYWAYLDPTKDYRIKLEAGAGIEHGRIEVRNPDGSLAWNYVSHDGCPGWTNPIAVDGPDHGNDVEMRIDAIDYDTTTGNPSLSNMECIGSAEIAVVPGTDDVDETAVGATDWETQRDHHDGIWGPNETPSAGWYLISVEDAGDGAGGSYNLVLEELS